MSFSFHQIFASERSVVRFRRRMIEQGKLVDCRMSPDTPLLELLPADTIDDDGDVPDLCGLTLSGGGNRCAAFSLGVTQALDSLRPDNENQVFDALDYISTVSGGGYMGTSIVAGLMQAPYTYPFASKLDSDETEETKHLRNFSNFLVPNGFIDYLTSLALVLRGLTVNAVIVMPLILLLAVLTVACSPTIASLAQPDFFGFPLEQLPFPIANVAAFKGFTLTTNLVLLATAITFVSALITSKTFRTSTLDTRMRLGLYLGGLGATIFISAFAELQPLIIAGMFSAGGYSELPSFGVGGVLKAFGQILPTIAAVFAPIAGILVAVAEKLASIVKGAIGEDTWSAELKKRASLLGLYISALVVPVLLWIAYLYLAYWAVRTDDYATNPNAPNWLKHVPELQIFSILPTIERLGPIASAYLWAALFLIFVCLFLGPNSNSLHQLYRDRLSKAFLFTRSNPRSDDGVDVGNWTFSSLKQPTSASRADIPVDWRFGASFSPYLLVNTAINMAGSKDLNKRGRNADNFIFSPLFIGSQSTGYARTEDVEAVTNLSLATAMATSGAAASANMGNHTIPILTFSLSMLNVRLGYWLANPNQLEKFASWKTRLMANIGTWYFATEASGRMNETRYNVYLTDGGHIENLGIYELLRRRCKVIVAVDGEADPNMTFDSFVKLQIIARIDLGIRIDLPWKKIAKRALATSKVIGLREECEGAKGPHGAIGIIHYGQNEFGLLFYIKSSITGDENDYIIDYKARNPTYPHETTLDQFFSEEQFEVYRALGFHATRGFFTGVDEVAQPDERPGDWSKTVGDALKRLNIPKEMIDTFTQRLEELS
ncbi:hypothetical protein GFM29_19950 [Rhizobium leguminosarum bv. viciae]|nr:hypothetical protein [Rhizobium leguminosarum bv. viciae]